MAAAVRQWEPVVPPSLRDAFRAEFMQLAHDHERALATIAEIWGHRDRAYAFDEGTGLARRQPFMTHLTTLLTASSDNAGAVCVLFLDLDGLKSINDRSGHEAGDRAIAAAGHIIRDAVRVDRHEDVMMRTGEEDLAVSRNGGDEFLIALELKTPDDVANVAPRVKLRVDDPARQRAYGYVADPPLSISVGAVACRLPVPPLIPAQMVRELIATADGQMYASKRDGHVHVALGHFTNQLTIEREWTIATQ